MNHSFRPYAMLPIMPAIGLSFDFSFSSRDLPSLVFCLFCPRVFHPLAYIFTSKVRQGVGHSAGEIAPQEGAQEPLGELDMVFWRL